MNAECVEQKLWELRITKQRLCAEMGITPSTLWRYLAGKHARSTRNFEIVLEAAFKRLEEKITAEALIKKIPTCVKCGQALPLID